jgi:hypothetical protein
MKKIYNKPTFTELELLHKVSILEGSRQTRWFDAKEHQPGGNNGTFNSDDFWNDDTKQSLKKDDLAF